MDFFGIGAAIEGAMRVYFASARQTGRTFSLVESLKNGDRVCFVNSQQAERVKKLCKEREIDIEYIIVDPHRPEDIFQYGSVSGDGRTIFDHVWLEEFYLHVIEQVRLRVDYLERETSGYGAAHRETKRQAIEMAKWGI